MAIGKTNYPETPGKGVMYFTEAKDKKHEMSPDFQGFILLECDYKAGEKLYLGAWQKPTSRGNTLLSIKEDNWLKRKKLEQDAPVEVTPAYRRAPPRRGQDDDSDLPF